MRDGFARNFLLPKYMAKLATREALLLREREYAAEKKYAQEEEKRVRDLASRINTVSLMIPVRMGERGKAFGSVSSRDIQSALREKGIEVDKEWIALASPLKTQGAHTVVIQFPYGLQAELHIEVTATPDDK
ncbi:MAG: large subunit ribosomal protein L9 [Parcubacteria group bacterium Gr01-1014_66]|nr:MAG: large subunit ribosomal protein L9 [Parcubacteria group bacterium Gr01-1014_66]